MFESSHFETLKFIIPNFLCFHPIVFPVKREGHFSPLPPFSVSCILFVAPRRSLNETRHFRTLSSWHKYFGPILRRSLRFPRLEKHVHAKESTLGFSFFPLSLLFFFFFSPVPLPRGNFLRATFTWLAVRGFVWNRGTLRGEISIAAFSLPGENYYRSSSKVLVVVVTYWTADDPRRSPPCVYRSSRIDT